MTPTRKGQLGLRIAAGVAVLFGLLTIVSGGRALFGGPEARAAVGNAVPFVDRGIPTEAVLTEVRSSDPPVYYLVGTPRGTPDPPGAAADRQALAGGPQGCPGQAAGRG
jgi:hypothetical protein